MVRVVTVAVVLAGGFARADVESGPKPGAAVPELTVFAVTGPVENKAVDYAAERKGMQLESTALTAFAGDAGGPAGWAINADAHLTAVVAADGKVAKAFAFVSVNETDVKAVVEALTAATRK